MTLEQATNAVKRRKSMEAERGYAPLIITTKKDGKFIGSGGLAPVQDTSETEVVYHLMPSAWGKGYATEAAVAILGFAFRTVKLEQVLGLAFPDNVASWTVLHKAGMRYVGLARYYDIDGLRKYLADRATWAPRVQT